MPLKNYGVLVGRVVDSRAEGGADTPHFQVHVRAAAVDYRIAVNVLSSESPSELLYLADEHFSHPLLAQLPALPDGVTVVPSAPGGIALDYIRGNLFDRGAMKVMPATAPGPDNDLADKLAHYVDRAAADPDARVYAFGERWGPEEDKPDKIFGFRPGNGVHDIHMNQGNSDRFVRDDGVWQDGGLLLHFPGGDQWVAIFLAFQGQKWHTDDVTGHTIVEGGGPANVASATEPDRRMRIVAALVNPVGPAPERETITVLNASPAAIDLTGWSVVDRAEHRASLPAQTLPAGATASIVVTDGVVLGNKGGAITLLAPDGRKVHGVSYTAQQAKAEGWTLTF